MGDKNSGQFVKGQVSWNKGLLNDIDITGNVYGYLTAISRDRKVNWGEEYYWLCKCKCGNNKSIRKSSLISGKTRSCGCYDAEIKKRIRLDNYGAIKRKIYRRYKYGAIERNLIFDLSFDYFISIIEKKCYYCNAEGYIKTSTNKNHPFYKSNGIDRIDSYNGYVIGNVVPCCRNCNVSKNDKTQKEFAEWIINVYNNLPSWKPTN